MRKGNQLLFAGIALFALSGGASAAESDTASQLEALSQRVDQLEQEAASNNLDTRIKAHMAGYAAVGYTDVEEEDGRFNQVLFAPI